MAVPPTGHGRGDLNPRERTLERVRAVFDQLVEAPSAEREARLTAACGGDDLLAREVQALLAAHDQAEGFLERPPPGTTLLGPEESIGPWRVLRELGQGGMGRVYLVERVGDEFTQVAACKVLPLANVDDLLLGRFRLERQALARLEHPGIARMLDGGTTQDGLPYYVMEYVEGPPVDIYCRENELSVRARLEIFVQICSAVEHAHRNLIVHRDIKPGNVLVARGPQGRPLPKLLDFGIAKILDESEPDATRTLTRWMTPHYASPEQIQGKSVTTSSDVYSLGVLLYRVLTGLLPFDLPTRDVYGYERAVCEGDPIPPRRRLSHAAAAPAGRGLPEDLDWVLLKALEREPERRYASVEQFADDVRRLLAGLPVRAREGTFGYTLRRFIGRNKLLVGAGTTLVLLLLLGLAGLLWSSRRIQDEADRVERINQFLLGLFRQADPDLASPGLTYVAAVERIATSIDEEFAADPDVRASLHSQVGQTFHRLGRSDQALDQLEQALAILRGMGDPDRRALGQTLLRLSEVHLDRARIDAAVREAREALAQYDRVRDLDPLALARAQGVLAMSLLESDGLEEARGLLVSALAVYRSQPVETVPIPEFVRALNNLGLADRLLDRSEEAERAFGEALALARDRLDSDHPAHALVLYNLGSLILGGTRGAEAEQLLERCVRIRIAALGDAHPDVALALNQLALAEMALGEDLEAEEHLVTALAILGEAAGDADEELRLARLQSLDAYASLLFEKGDHDASVAAHRELVQAYADERGSSAYYADLARKNLAKPLFAAGRLEEARAQLTTALENFEARGDGDASRAGIVRSYLADVLIEQGEAEAARVEYERALAALLHEPEWAHTRIVATRLGLWRCAVLGAGPTLDPCDALSELRELSAEASLDPALELRTQLVRAACLIANDEPSAAAALAAASVEELRVLLGEQHPWVSAAEAERTRLTQ